MSKFSQKHQNINGLTDQKKNIRKVRKNTKRKRCRNAYDTDNSNSKQVKRGNEDVLRTNIEKFLTDLQEEVDQTKLKEF